MALLFDHVWIAPRARRRVCVHTAKCHSEEGKDVVFVCFDVEITICDVFASSRVCHKRADNETSLKVKQVQKSSTSDTKTYKQSDNKQYDNKKVQTSSTLKQSSAVSRQVQMQDLPRALPN